MMQNRYITLITSILLVYLFYCNSVYAEPVAVEVTSETSKTDIFEKLEDYIKYALHNNPGLKASYERWQAALEKVEPAGALPDPKLSFSSYIEEVETRVGAQKYSLSLSQTFPWFGKLDLMSNAALQEANVEKARYEAQKLKLISTIKKLYYDYSYLALSIGITEDNITLVSNFESVAQAKYKGGTGLQNAVIKIQVELGKLEDRLASLRDSTKPMATKLNSAMNRPAGEVIPLPEEIQDERTSVNREELLSLLRDQNPELKALDYMAEKNLFLAGLADKNQMPDITFGLNYIQTEPRTDSDPPDNGKDPFVASVSINIPLWKKKYDALKRSSQTEYRSVLQRRRETENSLIANLEMALFELRDAERKIELYRDTLIPRAEQNLNITQLAFTSDQAGFLDLIDAQRALLEFQLAEKKAFTDYSKAFAEIETFTGYKARGE